MTAVALFDVLFRGPSATSSVDVVADPAVDRLAAQLVEWSLAEWSRVEQYEADFTPLNWDNITRAIEIERSIYSLHEQWVSEAMQVFTRVQRMTAAGRSVPKLEELNDALGFSRARLKMTPEKIASAMEQIRAGQSIPAKELRDELCARVRT